jgi:hypothetical protein
VRFAWHFGLQKSSAEAQICARIFATVGSDVMHIGYAGVSTLDQNLDLQIQALRKAGCKKIFREKVSGASRERPEFRRRVNLGYPSRSNLSVNQQHRTRPGP